MKVLAFAASSSSNSINKKLVTYAASLLSNAEVEILDINDYEMPLYSEDKEKELGQPEAAKRFFNKIGAADALLISFAEHNGSYTAAYKNLYDWTSRIDPKVYQGKPMVMLATSPGPGGPFGPQQVRQGQTAHGKRTNPQGITAFQAVTQSAAASEDGKHWLNSP